MADNSISFALLAKDMASPAFKKVGDSAQGATGHISKMGVAMAAAGLAAAGLAVEFGRKSVDAFKSVATETIALQRSFGGTAEAASRLRFEAQETGVSADALGVGLKTLSTHLVNNDKAAKSLGISYRDAHGQIKPFDVLLPEIADHFKNMAAGPERSAEAVKLFGRQGLTLLPFLAKGSEGLKELGQQSDKLGLTLSGPSLAALKKNNLAHKELHAAVQGLQVQVGAFLMPILAKLATSFTSRVAPAVASVTKFFLDHRDTINNLVTPVIQKVQEVFSKVSDTLRDLLPHIVPLADPLRKIAEFFGQGVLSAITAVVGMFKDFGTHLGLVKSNGAGASAIFDKLKGVFEYISRHPEAAKIAGQLTAAIIAASVAVKGYNLTVSAVKSANDALQTGMVAVKAAWDGVEAAAKFTKVAYMAATTEAFRAAVATKAKAVGDFFAAGAAKAYAAAQWAVNAALDANPIVLAATVLIGLGVAFYEAYKHCATFRNIVQGTFGWIKDHWPLLVQIIGAPIEPLVQLALHFNAFKKVALEGIRIVLGAFLDMVSGIIHGAASAFGWVPGLGGKLKSARDAFDKFKSGVLDDLNSLEGDHVVHVNVRTAVGDAAQEITNPAKAGRYVASGGLIRGPGGPRDDLIPAYLSNGEAVVPAHLVPEIAPWAASRGIPGFANGGLVVQTNAATAANGLGAQLRSIVDGALQRMASSFLPAFSGGGGGAGVQRWAGLVSQVLSMFGLNTPDYVGRWLRQIQSESGGNPSIVQGVHDVNSGGNEAVGLVQVTPGTFASYAGPFVGLGRTNPLANLYAGVAWDLHKNQSPFADIGFGHGYANGGITRARVPFIAGENGAELITAPGSLEVHNASATRRLLGGDVYNITIVGGNFTDPASRRRQAVELLAEVSRLKANGHAMPANSAF